VSDPRAALGARGELLAAVVYVLLGRWFIGGLMAGSVKS